VTFLILGKPGAQLQHRLADVVQEKGWKVMEFKQKPYTLEETFLTLTEPETKELAKAPAASNESTKKGE
jgi:hypothetical protein